MMPTLHRAALCILSLALVVLTLRAAQAGEDKVDLEAAKKQDADNFRRISAAVLKYATGDQGGGWIPPAAVMSQDGKSILSWRVLVLPYLGEAALYNEFKHDQAWDSPHNKKLLKKMPKVYAPVRGKGKDGTDTYYQAFVGGGAGFEPDKTVRYPSAYTDGLGNTVMLAEAAEAVPWTKPQDLVYDPNKELPKLGGMFPDGFHVAMFRGEVLYFRSNFDKQEMRHVITRAGGEIMNFAKLKR